MYRTATRFTCFALTLLAATAAGAAEKDGPSDDDSSEGSKSYSWGLGVGAISQQQPYTDIDRENMALPLIYFENRWVELLGPRLNFKLPELELGEDQELEFGVGIEFDFNGYEAKDAPILNGMADRKEGLLAGVSTEWSNPFVNVSADWMVDVSGEHDGQRASFGLERSFQLGEHFSVTPGAAAIYLDKKYANYYYGVRSVEARAGRPAYLVDSTVNAEFSLRTDYLINPRQMLFVSLEYTALGSEIKDSPLVDDSGETEIFLGYLYRF